MKYAADNRLVRWFYALTTGPRRHIFYLAIALLIGVGIYLPVRDFYIAHRTESILQEQKAISDAYNEKVGKEVESLLSQEGAEDAARRELGMVKPGERTITVEGLDEEGEPVVVDVAAQDAEDPKEGQGASDPAQANGAAPKNDEGKIKGEDAAKKNATGAGSGAPAAGKSPATSAEVDAAQKAVLENSAWYWKVLDSVFLFDGTGGMAVVSTGE